MWRLKWNPGNGVWHFSPVSHAASGGAVFPLTRIGLQGIPFALPVQTSPVNWNLITSHDPMSSSWPYLWRAMGMNTGGSLWRSSGCHCSRVEARKPKGVTGCWVTPHTHIAHSSVRQQRHRSDCECGVFWSSGWVGISAPREWRWKNKPQRQRAKPPGVCWWWNSM